MKPEAELIGANGNIFNLIAIARKALRKAGLDDEGKEMADKIYKSDSYDDALAIIMEYVDPV